MCVSVVLLLLAARRQCSLLQMLLPRLINHDVPLVSATPTGAALQSTVAAAGTFIRDSIPISVYMAIQGQALTGQGLTTLAKLGPQGGFVVDANLGECLIEVPYVLPHPLPSTATLLA